MDEDDCDKLDSDCEKVAADEQDLQRAMAVSDAPQKRDCSAELHLSLNNSFHSFPCAIKGVTTLPHLPSDFLDPVVSKAAALASPSAGTVSLSHFEASDKPRIWSLARTAASGVILSPQQHDLELRTGSLTADCQLQSTRLSGAPTGQCGDTRGLHDSGSTESSYPEGSSLHSKVYGTSNYNHKGLQLLNSSYAAAVPETCQYRSLEGMTVSKFRFSSVHSEAWALNNNSCPLMHVFCCVLGKKKHCKCYDENKYFLITWPWHSSLEMGFLFGLQHSLEAKWRFSRLTSARPVGLCRMTRSLRSDQSWRGEAGESLHWAGRGTHTHTCTKQEHFQGKKSVL